MSVDTGEEVQLSDKFMHSPAFSNDGKLVAYFVNQPNIPVALEVMSLDTRAVLKTFPLEGEHVETMKTSWTPDGKTVTYTFASAGETVLWQVNLSDWKPRKIANLGNEQIVDLATSPDGKRQAFIRGKWVHDAVLIQGLK